MTKISAVIITLNEEHSIERTLRSLDFCDEIVVVDSGSTDATVAVCEKYKCRVFTRPFNGYGAQKQYAVSQAMNDWVFSIDADELVSDGLKREIVSVFSSGDPLLKGYYVPISLIFLGKRMRFSGVSRKLQLRLFNRQESGFTKDIVHERVVVSGKTAVFGHRLLHYSYDNLQDYFTKFGAYTTAAAQSMFEKKRKAASFMAVVSFPLTFLRIYLFRLGFLDGYQGFMWALFSSMYPVVKFTKLRELYRAASAASLAEKP
jgi:glycosyltransferase involved in cell wall biosynthesis